MSRMSLDLTLRLDAAVHLLVAALLAALAPRLAEAAGLGAGWPVWLLAGVFLVLGADNWLAARRPARWLVAGVIAGDVVYALAAATFVVAGPTGTEAWLRWLVLLTVPAALAMAALKAHGLGRGVPAPASR